MSSRRSGRTPKKDTESDMDTADTPSRRSTRSGKSTPAKSPRRSKTPSKAASVSSPSSLQPMPPSPSSEAQNAIPDTSLLTSPRPPVNMDGVSEIDLTSPLNYGTPSSRIGATPRTPGIGATPIHVRPDVRSDRRMRTVPIGGDPVEGATRITSELVSDPAAGPQMVIWGTDVVVSHCKEKFRRFIDSFVQPDIDADEHMDAMDVDKPLYMQALDEIHMVGDPFLNVNCAHLKQFDSDLYRQLVAYPQEVIPTFDMAANEVFFDKYPDTALEHQIQVRPFNADITQNMRSLNPEDIDQLITISGMIIRTSTVIPEMREAFFQCHICKNTMLVELERGRIAEPTLCRKCNTNYSYHLVHNRSQFTDKQMVKVQESPDDMPPGQTPHTITVFAHSDLVDKVQPGDRVTITGIYRAQPMRVNPRMRNVKAVYKTHIDVVHYRKLDLKRLHLASADDDKTCHLTPDRIEEVKAAAADPAIYNKLAEAIAPSIFENIDVKKGILLQLFGGAIKKFEQAGRSKFRADVNILLCGDPGTSKSQLLQYVHKLAPRGQYTSGKGSSAVGLTAYITKDPETRQLVLQTGALVLSDNGICCIDEFDKMNESTRSVLHEVMEQQTLSIAKAGIICQLNARTSILAAANPVESQWNDKKTIIENVQLPHTLLSRFDLIYLILDPKDEAFDRRLARHLVSLYYQDEEDVERDTMTMDMLKDYLGYARRFVNPKLTEEATHRLIKEYVNMRQEGSGRGQVSAYPRQLESLIRLSEAHAKMRLSPNVEDVDVDEARRIHRKALMQTAVDPATGRIDMTILATGQSGANRKMRADRAKALLELFLEKGAKGPSFAKQKLYELFRERSAPMFVTTDQYEEALRDLQDDGHLVVTGAHVRSLAKN